MWSMLAHMVTRVSHVGVTPLVEQRRTTDGTRGDFGVWGLVFGVCGLRFVVWGLGFGFSVWGLGFRVGG